MFILEDEATATLPLPRRYGIDDIPVIVQDKQFRRGALAEGEHGPVGLLGDTLLVNGTVGPFLDISTERVRLRLLNASTARVYSFGFSDDRSFALIGTDGGLLSAPYETTGIQLFPGERAEIIVTITPGETVTLRFYPPDLGTSKIMTGLSGGQDAFDVLQLRAAARLESSPPVPDHLGHDRDLGAGQHAQLPRSRRPVPDPQRRWRPAGAHT